MKLNFGDILDVLFPLSEDEKRIARYTQGSFLPKSTPYQKNGVWSLLSFADPDVRAAIHLNKYHNHEHAQKLLAYVLQRWLRTHIRTSCLLLPVPLSKQRQQKRGHNQVTSVAQQACVALSNILIHERVLMKIKDTPAQTSLTKHERLNNLTGAYECTSEAAVSIAGKDLVLLDDVITTGATLREAKAALLPHKPKSIICVALAH